MTDELTTKSLAELASLIRLRAVSPVEVVDAHLNRIERLNPQLNAVITLAPDAVDAARASEAAIIRGELVGPLHGVPVTIKDTIETAQLRTTSGSRMRASYVPQKDAPAVARLRAAGAIVIGKTNVSEMAAGYDTENPLFGRANNPYDLSRTTGGSSGGEAAAIAACMSTGGLGSDLMGSIRVPAHFCGIAGLKPTTGRVPCGGHIPRSAGPTSLGAVIGPMARHVGDLALLFHAIAGLHAPEPLSAPSPVERGDLDVSGLRVAWYTDDLITPVTNETRLAVEATAQALTSEGLIVRDEKPPGVERGQDLWTRLFARSALLEMRKEYENNFAQAGSLVRHLLDASIDAPQPSLDDFAFAWIERDHLRAALVEWMLETPLIIAPVGAMPAFEHGARKIEIDNQAITIFRAFSYSQTYNVFGLPAVCVPAGTSPEGLPVGVQVVGLPFAEETVLAAARIIEESLGGWQMPSLALSNSAEIRI